MISIRLFVLGACLCTMLAYSFFLQSCFVFLNVFSCFKNVFCRSSYWLCGCFMSDIVLLIDRLYCIDLFSCIAASLFNKLTYLHRYGNSHATWDHSVACHPAEVTFPPLPQPKLVLD